MQLSQKDLHRSFNITKISKTKYKLKKKTILAESLCGLMHTFVYMYFDLVL